MEHISPCLSVVMPCYNEANTVELVAGRVLASPYTKELIIVDDGSTDGTRERLSRIDDRRVRVLEQPTNCGKGAALRRGFAEASAPFVIVQDADLEYDPADFHRIMGPLLGGQADVVYGSRFMASQPRRVLYFWHSVGNKLLTTASNMFTNLNLTDMETCYKAFRREVLDSFEIEEDRFGFEPEITAKLAAGGWRIYEVGIAYFGRTYSEGKKIGWRDGVHALVCVVRYSSLLNRHGSRRRSSARPTNPAEVEVADAELAGVLESLDGAVNYADWIFELASPYLGREILEVGAGHGTLTRRLRTVGRVTATEISERCVDILKAAYDGDDAVEVRHGDLAATLGGPDFDSAVLVNVLEHIEDDAEALRLLAKSIRPQGTIVLFVPALQALYSDFDRKVGHHRRYERSTMTTLVKDAGFKVVDLRYVNVFGAFAWWVLARQLGATPTDSRAVRIYDRLIVPLARRLETRWQPPIGQSLLCAARRL